MEKAPQRLKFGPQYRLRRGPKPSRLQKDMVRKFMEAHPDLARGRLNGPEPARRASDLWRRAAERLNAAGVDGGCNKDWKGWRKYWNDKKVYLKGLQERRLLYATQTEVPYTNLPPLGEWEERILSLLEGSGPSPDTTWSHLSSRSKTSEKMEPGSPATPAVLQRLYVGGAHRAKQIQTTSTGSEDETSHTDISAKQIQTTSIGSEDETSHTEIPDPLLEESEENWEWYEEENGEEQDNKEKLFCGDLSREEMYPPKKKVNVMIKSPETQDKQIIVNKEIVTQSNQSFGMFVATELQQYETLERYEIMKQIIDIFIKK